MEHKKQGPALSREEGFTLIEMIVVIAIVAVLSSVVLYSSTQYIAKGKDSTVKGQLSVLITAGEVYYNSNGSYADFCDPTANDKVKNVFSQIPIPQTWETCSAKPCCIVKADGTAWYACSPEFAADTKAFCVDSRGVAKDVALSDCSAARLPVQCPE